VKFNYPCNCPVIMAESSVRGKHFEHLVEYALAVCRECQHGVLPSHIKSHVQRAHPAKRKQAKAIAEEVGNWAGLIQYAGELEVPSQVIEPIHQLPVYKDGLMCQVDPNHCCRIFRKPEGIRKHWRDVHRWSAAGKGGHPTREKQKEIQERISQHCKKVHCQRLLVQGQGSQYFQVHQPGDDGPDVVPVNGEAAWAQVGEQMAKAWANVETRAQDTIQQGEKDEVNPWLERTQWLPYLVGMERPELLACIEEPVADPDPRQEQQAEPVEAAMWAAMEGLARFSQASVIHRIGVFVRLEAIRTEKHQTRFQPLQPYMDEKSIGDHTRPWQQILMFFARTQREHAWKSPAYRFARRQREAWEAFVKAAERSVEGEEDEEEEEDDEEDEEEGEVEAEDREDETMADVDEAIDEMETGTAEPTANAISEPERLSGIQRACLEFCIALLSQSITRKEYDSPLVCALAVLGVKEDGWKGAEQYPPVLSAVIKVARFMVVQQALELSGPSDNNEFDSDSAYESDNSSNPPRRRRKGCLQFVQEMMDRFMVRGSHSPMQWMLDLRTYGLKIHYNTTSRGHVEWVGKEELLYKDLQFSMAQFRGMVHGLVTESRRLIMDELLFGGSRTAGPIPSVPWDSLRDNPTDERPGWNFLKDQRTRMPVDGESWLFERVGQDAAIRDRFVKRGARSGVNTHEVERYMDRVVAFREKLAVLIHMAYGQPARWPELGSVRHSNTVKGGHRNMFIEDGMVVIATRYHKGYHVSGDVKIIHRYLPREVGELVVYYMWLVLPFQQRLEAMVWEKEAISSHMWPADPSGRKWTGDRFREVLKRESRMGMGLELTIAAYREVAIGISRRFLRASTAFRADEGDENGAWEEENTWSAIADLQAGHTTHIAGMVYARGIMEQAGAVADKRQQFRASSTDWHRFLGFQAGDIDSECKKRKRAPFETEADEARVDRWDRLRRMDTTAQLQRMMGKAAEFRGVQKEAIDAIVAGRSHVVAVMPTGAGKSMLFMLPAWAEQGGTTVVVVPLIALRGDMMRRCRKLGISCAEWEGRRPPDAAAIVLVTPESAVGEEFATFLNRLRATRQLDRIVIDECHIVLNRRYDFRKEMQRLGKLVAAETQMVMLTATLPPSEENELFRRMYVEREQVDLFRAPTARTNVAYRVIRVGKSAKKKEVDEMVVRMVQQKLRKYRKGKVVVYSNSVPKVKELAGKLDCHAYHNRAVGKASMLEAFAAGNKRVVVATSALGMGVDIADIRCIVHIDWPFSVLDYAQESGRAGRDGSRSEAVMIVQEGQQRAAADKQGEVEQQLVAAYVEGICGQARCRRVVLDGYLDRREEERVRCEEGEEKCDVCSRAAGEEVAEEAEEDKDISDSEENSEENSEVGSSSGECATQTEQEERRQEFEQQQQARRGPRQTLMGQRQQEFAEVEWLRQQLARWAKRCAICEAAGAGASGHDVRQCWRVESRRAQAMIKVVEEKIKMEAYSGCFWCGVPQEVCNRWEDNGRGRYQRAEGTDCQYRGVLVAGLMGLVYGDEGKRKERWCERLEKQGVDVSSIEDLVRHLGGKQQLERVESNRLVGEFCWITRLIAE
jgi:RecQ family ATP-dependent DNA helicase